MLLDGNSAVGLIGGKVARVSSVSEPFTICAKHKRKKNSQEKLLSNEATMGNIINSLVFLFLWVFSKSLVECTF